LTEATVHNVANAGIRDDILLHLMSSATKDFSGGNLKIPFHAGEVYYVSASAAADVQLYLEEVVS
jgi:hypothetical protein